MKSLRPSVSSVLAESLSRNLNRYVLAAGAAAAGLLALEHPSEAEIIYTPTDIVLGAGGIHTYDLDLDGDGITDFEIRAAHRCDTDQCFYNLFDRVPPGNSIVGRRRGGGRSPQAAALKMGALIGPSQRFLGRSVTMASFYYGGGGSSANGNWANVRNRFLGLSFKINGETHYGWARLSVKDARLSITAVLTGYAYETEPNKAITAGQTSEVDASLATPPNSHSNLGTLGALALGSHPRKTFAASTF